jgi:hypothetical protein
MPVQAGIERVAKPHWEAGYCGPPWSGFALRMPRSFVCCRRPTAPKEVAMLIMGIHQVPSLTQERYEEVVRRLTNDKGRLESLSDLPFEGLLMHVAGQGKDGFYIVDVFESQEAVDRFNEAMGSIPKEVGIEEPPKFFPAHTFISA